MAHTPMIPVPAALVAVLLATSCGRDPAKPDDRRPMTATVERRDLVETCEEDGLLQASRVFTVYPHVEGEKLVKVFVKEGDTVKQGDKLFQFDVEPTQRKITHVSGRLKATQLKLAQLMVRKRADILEARQALLAAKARKEEAARTLAIEKQMQKQGMATATTVGITQDAADAASMSLELAQSRLAELEKGGDSPEAAELEATVNELEAQLKQLKEKEAHCTGITPLDGRVIGMDNHVKAISEFLDDTSYRYWGGRPLLTIADTSTMKILANFFESDIARIRVGQSAIVTAEHAPGATFEGKVTFIGERGQARGQTSTITVEVTVENPQQQLKPGLTAVTRIIVNEKRNVLVAPVEYLRRQGDSAAVWVDKRGRSPRLIPVKTGISDGEGIEILEGLDKGDVLVME